MATHDYDIANQSGAAFRTDLNNALKAIQTNNSNSSSPSSTEAYQWWADTTSGTLKIRNAANNAWIELLQLDGTLTLEDGSQTAPALAFRNDPNTGIFRSAADKFEITTGGVEKMSISTGGMSINDTGADFDVRIEGDTEQNLVYINAGLERVGLKTSSPDALLHLKDTVSPARVHVECTTANSFPGLRVTNDAQSYDLQIDGTTDDFRIFDVTAATERLRIETSTGNIGINTSAPESNLHINLSSSSDGPILRFTNPNGGDGTYLGRINTADTAGAFFAGINFFKHDSDDGEIRFRMKVAGTNTDVLTLVDGFCGIGTSSPAKKLHVFQSGVATIQLETGDSRGQAFNFLSTNGSQNNTGTLSIRNEAGQSFIDFSHNEGSPFTKIYNTGSEQFRFDADGIKFNGDSAAANGLDDYEEGSFTPAVSGITYNDAQGHYVKVGTVCFVTISINQSNTSKTGDTVITGLPFASKSGSGEYYPTNSVPFFEVSGVTLPSGFNNLYGRIEKGNSTLQILATDGEQHGIMTVGSGTTLGSNHSLRTAFSYQTNA